MTWPRPVRSLREFLSGRGAIRPLDGCGHPSCCAQPSSCSSRQRRATNCNPSGSPFPARPAGSVIDGSPACVQAGSCSGRRWRAVPPAPARARRGRPTGRSRACPSASPARCAARDVGTRSGQLLGGHCLADLDDLGRARAIERGVPGIELARAPGRTRRRPGGDAGCSAPRCRPGQAPAGRCTPAAASRPICCQRPAAPPARPVQIGAVWHAQHRQPAGAGRSAPLPADRRRGQRHAGHVLREQPHLVQRAREEDQAPGSMRSRLGLKPTTPQKAAGRITEPIVWVPRASGARPAATAAAEPLLEPPGVWARRAGCASAPARSRRTRW